VRRSRIAAAAGVVVVLAIGGTVAWRLQHRGPGRASVNGAIDRFRTASTVASSTRAWEPRPGVYLYSGAGAESLSFLGTHQTQGPTEPGTVTQRPNDCWQFRIDYNSFHHQTWNRCSTATKLVESGGTADQQFDFVAFKTSEHGVTTCAPPFVVADLDAKPGTSTRVHCTGHSQTTKATFTQTGTATYVGRENVSVGNAAVPAVHTRQDLHLSGGQTGTSRVDIWLAVADGLPLKETHSISVDSPAPAPINHVTYTERGSWHLTSLTPRG
jgi:hypothetical protein